MSLSSPSLPSSTLGLDRSHLIGHLAWLLVLIRKLHTQHAITNAQRGHLKEIVLSWEENGSLLMAFHRFIENQDKEALVDALLELLPTEEEDSADELNTNQRTDEDPEDMESRAWARVNATIKQVRPPATPQSLRPRPNTASTTVSSAPRSQTRPRTAASTDAESDLDSTLDDGSNSFVSISYQEAKHLASVVQILGFDKLGLDTLWDLFEEHAYYDGLNRSSFELVLSHLVIYARAGHRLTVTRTMYRIFDLLDREKRGIIDLAELVAGLALFCCGEEQHKLRFAFDMMDTDNKNALTQEQVFRFLYSFSAILSAFLYEHHHPIDISSPTATAKSHTLLSPEQEEAVWNRAHRLFTMADLEMNETVDVQQFLEWSNNPASILETFIGHVWQQP